MPLFPLVLAPKSDSSFQIYALVDDALYKTAYALYEILVSDASTPANPVTSRLSAMGQWTPRLAVTVMLENPDVFPQTVNVAVHADILLIDEDSPPMHSLDLRTGIGITNYADNVTFLLSNSQEVTPMTTYWFGPYGGRENHVWTQVSTQAVAGTDTGLAFSWQKCVVPASGSLNLTFVVHSLGVSAPPVLTITSTFPSAITLPSSISVRGSATTSLFDASICIVGVADIRSFDLGHRHCVGL
jgi:hypothetical protein